MRFVRRSANSPTIRNSGAGTDGGWEGGRGGADGVRLMSGTGDRYGLSCYIL
jgi:hypothetical protein